METLVLIAIETKDCTEGNHAWFDAKLKPNSIIEISWGDGKKSTMKTYDNSKLKIVVNGTYTRIDANSLKWLQMTVDRNGGHLKEEWLDREFSSVGCFGEES